MIQKVANLLCINQKIVLFAHKQPDADALGGCNALRLALEKQGKDVCIFCDGTVDFKTEFLNVPLEKDEMKIIDADLLVLVDCSEPSRTGKYEKFLVEAENVTIIDHHKTQIKLPKISWVDPNKCSASEMVYDIIKLLKIDIDKDIALNLYAGISSDTGRFLHQNITPSCLIAAADLLSYGFDFNTLNFELFQKRQGDFRKFLDVVLKNYTIFNDKVSGVVIDYKTYKKIEDSFDGDEIYDLLARVDTDIFFKAIEKVKGEYYIGFRSRTIDVRAISQRLGGGGHKCAAGAVMPNISKTEVVKKILKECEK